MVSVVCRLFCYITTTMDNRNVGLLACVNAVAVAALAMEDDLDDEDTLWEKVTAFVDDYVRMGDPAFRMHFRLTREQCEILYDDITNHLQDKNVIVELPNGRPFSHQLLMVLWIFATPDSFRSVALRFDSYKSDVHRYYVKIITALREMAPRYIKWPTREERYQIKTHMQGYSEFPGVIGMIDGKHFEISKPLEEPAAYRDHHHRFSIKAQAVCDHTLLIRDLYVGEAGSLHDARVFRRSPLCQSIIFDENLMEPDEHIVGDAAYMLMDRVLTPFDNNGHLTPQQRNYNYLHSRSRMAIERTFGKLTTLWRRNHYLHSYNIDYAVDHIASAFVLHNFKIIHGQRHALANIDIEDVEDMERINVNIDPEEDDEGFEDVVDDEFVPQGDGAHRLAQARLRGEQKRWQVCNALPLIRE